MTNESARGSVRRNASSAWLLCGTVGLVLLHWLLGQGDGINVWGIGYWSDLPATTAAALAAVLMLSLLPGYRFFQPGRMAGDKTGSFVSITLISLFALMAALFPTRGLSYGDGYTIASVTGSRELPQLHGNLLLQPLDILTHWAVNRFLMAPLGGGIRETYSAVGLIAGVLTVIALWRIGGHLGQGTMPRLLMVAAGLSSGLTAYWFGHVESYTLCMTASIWMCDAVLTRRRLRAWVFTLLAAAFHVLALMWLPVLLLGFDRDGGKDQNRRAWLVRQPGMAVAALFGFGGIAAGALPWLGVRTFVSLLPAPESPYSAFSARHLADMANLVFFASPLIILTALVGVRSRNGQTPVPRAISLMAICGLVAAFWIDPTIGAFRDWDLLGMFGIPLSIACAWLIARRVGPGGLKTATLAVGVLAIAHAGVWIAVTQSEIVVAKRVDRVAGSDPHYTCEYDRGARSGPWGQVLTGQLGMHAEAIPHFRRRVACAPEDAISWTNLGIVYQTLGSKDSALTCYDRSRSLDSTNALYHLAFGQVAYDLGRYETACPALESAARLAPELYQTQMALGAAYLMLGRLDDAERQASIARGIEPGNPEIDTLVAFISRRRSPALAIPTLRKS